MIEKDKYHSAYFYEMNMNNSIYIFLTVTHHPHTTVQVLYKNPFVN